MVSFHAIKIMNSIEGGMLVYKDSNLEKKFALYRNFGIDYEHNDVPICGCNAKMNEFQATMGLCNLKYLETEIEKRKKIADLYIKLLSDINGISVFKYKDNIRYNHAYFPIKVTEECPIKRDELWAKLKEFGINTRKLYDKGTNEFTLYSNYKSDTKKSKGISKIALDLPIYGTLTENEVNYICDKIRQFGK